jgi:hypothetical protein
MENLTILYKVKQRLNKLDSNDYDNIETVQILEAFNKASVDWPRRQLHGTNLSKTGDEQTKRRIDDLQVLLREIPLTLQEKDKYFGSTNWPDNYFEYKRVSFNAKSDCCDRNDWVTYLVEEANIDIYLRDEYRKPNFEWGHTLITLVNNQVKIWTNNDFEIEDARLTYYKQPRRIEIQGVTNPYTGLLSATEVESEFKDDIVEVLIGETVKILAGDIENVAGVQIADKSVESNN